MSTHTVEAVNAAKIRIAQAVNCASIEINGIFDASRVHVGTANSKTGAVNEGTSPLVTCSAKACATCGCECYAVWHIDNVYPAARKNHAENTILRRLDPWGYYERVFAVAEKNGAALVRVNETGDFENVEQLAAMCHAAIKRHNMQVIGYTRRNELISALADCPDNVHVRYSLYRDGETTDQGDAVRACRCAAVSETDTTCPAQIAAANGKRWTCSDCARCKCGCASRRAVVVFRAH